MEFLEQGWPCLVHEFPCADSVRRDTTQRLGFRLFIPYIFHYGRFC